MRNNDVVSIENAEMVGVVDFRSSGNKAIHAIHQEFGSLQEVRL